MEDARFEFGPVPGWRGEGGKQAVLSTVVTEVEDTNVFEPHPSQLEWALDAKNPIVFDSLTRFRVGVSILVSTRGPNVREAVAGRPAVGERAAVEAVAAILGEWGDWTDCLVAEATNFRMAPVWFDKCWKTFNNFHYHDQPKQHNEAWHIPYELNSMLYWMMDDKLKDELCPEKWHPGRAVPTADKKWDFAEGSAWLEYAAHLLTGRTMEFSWWLLHHWPTFQGTNHFVQEGFRPRALNTKHTGKLVIKATPVDKFDNIFKIRAGVLNKRYKLVITKMKLCVEEARMSPACERFFGTEKSKVARTLHWPGVVKLMRNETISANLFEHTVKFEEVALPEIILIFALHKNVTGGSFKYQTHVENASHFVQHNIQQVGVTYGGFVMSMNPPDLGTVNNVHAERNVVRAYRQLGIFGMKVNPQIVNHRAAANGFTNTDFPHVAVHLVQTDGLEDEQPRSRTLPLLTTQDLLKKNRDLIVNLKFNNPNGSPADASFIIYLGYTDTCMIFKDKKFVSPYGLY